MSAEHWYAGTRPSHRPKSNPIAFLTELNSPAWMNDSLCAQTDPEAWFPEKGGSTREAKRVCASCDVREQCLAYALEHGERFGIWGGYSERERRHLEKNPGAVARSCQRDGCTQTIPYAASASRRFHNAECGSLARQDRLVATLDHQPVLTAYTAGKSVSIIAKHHKVPVGVISRILAEHGVRQVRGRRPAQAAS